jgi:hypothetical protein
MKPSVTYARRAGLAFVAFTALVAGALFVTPAGTTDADLKVESVAVQGQNVKVTVVNHGVATQTATIVVRVTLADGTAAGATSTVTVFGRQKAFVVFSMSMPVTLNDVTVVGSIIDDPTPF